jgi:hypothetical protein
MSLVQLSSYRFNEPGPVRPSPPTTLYPLQRLSYIVLRVAPLMSIKKTSWAGSPPCDASGSSPQTCRITIDLPHGEETRQALPDWF